MERKVFNTKVGESQYYPQFVSLDVDRFEDLNEKIKKHPDNIFLRERLRELEKKVKGNNFVEKIKNF